MSRIRLQLLGGFSATTSDGHVVQIPSGKRRALLACLASCGYGWEFTRAFDDEMALLVDYTIASTDTLCGSPQEQRWTYLARKTGTDVATLCYWPLFEPDPEPLRVRNIVLIVGE